MKKKLLIILPLLFGMFATSCSNEPATEPVNKETFVKNLNTIKEKADADVNDNGVKYENISSIETDLKIDGQSLNLLAKNKNTVMVFKNKLEATSKIDINGNTIIDEKIEKVKVNSNATFFSEYFSDSNKIKLMLSMDAKSSMPGKNEHISKKISSEIAKSDDENIYNEYLNNIDTSYGSFTSAQIDEALSSISTVLDANFGYIKEGEKEVFSVVQETKEGSNSENLNMRFTFDSGYLTKMDATSEVKAIDPETKDESYIKIKNIITAEKYNKEINAPNPNEYENISYSEFEAYLDQIN